MADTGSPAKRQEADLGNQEPRDTKVSFLALARPSAPGHKPSFPTRSQVLQRSTYERQVSGAKSEAFVGSTRPRPDIRQ